MLAATVAADACRVPGGHLRSFPSHCPPRAVCVEGLAGKQQV